MKQFIRAYTLKVDDVVVSEFDPNFAEAIGSPILQPRINFNIKRTMKPESDKASVSIWNLAPKTRALFQQRKKSRIELSAGYAEKVPLLFVGDLIHSSSSNTGVDVVTKFIAGDGHDELTTSVSSISAESGVRLEELIDKLMKPVNLGIGNAIDQAQAGNIKASIKEYTKGFSAIGNTFSILDDLLKSVDMEYTVQDEKLVVTPLGEPVIAGLKTPVISPQSGLIKSPEIGKDGDVIVKILLDPRLKPGGLVYLKSRVQKTQGLYRLEETEHEGDNYDQSWYTTFRGRSVEVPAEQLPAFDESALEFAYG